MANTTRRQRPQTEAAKLLRKIGFEKAPIPVEKIAKYIGAVIRFSPLDDEISGMVYIKDGNPIIGVNSIHHPHRQRFTIAHEIAHLVLHRDLVSNHVHVDKQFAVLMRGKSASMGTDIVEIEANKFAAELLMPTNLVTSALGGRTFDVDDDLLLQKLASQFGVSKQAMGHRVNALLEPLG